jgi:hypothetical protein
MFFEHNGHRLALLDDILPKLEKEMNDELFKSEEVSESNLFTS